MAKLGQLDALVATALIRAAASSEGARSNPYILRHLAGHIAAGGQWRKLASELDVLDHLDPGSVAAEALRIAGRADLPPAIAGVLGAHHLLIGLPPEARGGIRALATVRYSQVDLPLEAPARRINAGWRLGSAHVRRYPLQLVLPGHRGPVLAATALMLHGPEAVLFTAGADGAIWRWDPVACVPFGSPLMGHVGAVNAVGVGRLTNGRAFLVSAGNDRTVRIWREPLGGAHSSQIIVTHSAPVFGLAVVHFRDGRTFVVSADWKGSVYRYDVEAGMPIDVAGFRFNSAVQGMVSVVWQERLLLAVVTDSPKVLLWDPATAAPPHQLATDHEGPVNAVTSFVQGDELLIVTGGNDGVVGVWRPTGESVARFVAHSDPIYAVTMFPLNDEQNVLATGGLDGSIRLWDIGSGVEIGSALKGHDRPVNAIIGLSPRNRRPILTSAGNDGTVRLWGPVTDRVPTVANRPLHLLHGHGGPWAVYLPDGRSVVLNRVSEHSILFSDPRKDAPFGRIEIRFDEEVLAVTAVATPMGRWMVDLGTNRGSIWRFDTVDRFGFVALQNSAESEILGIASHDLLESGANGWRYATWDRQGVGYLFNSRHEPLVEFPVERIETTIVRDWHGDPMVATIFESTVLIEDIRRDRFYRDRLPSLLSDRIHEMVLIGSNTDSVPTLMFRLQDGELAAYHPDFGFHYLDSGHKDHMSSFTTFQSHAGRIDLATGGHDSTVRLWRTESGWPIPLHAFHFDVAIRRIVGFHRGLLAVAEDETFTILSDGT